MPRVKLQLPEKFIYSTEIAVRISDINYGGHLSNDAVLSVMHEARLRFLKSLGYSELDIEGISVIMADTAIVFKSEGFHGDVLQVEVTLGEISNSGFDIFYRLTNIATNKEVAQAKTGMVFYDYAGARVCHVPEGFLTKVKHQILNPK